CRRPLNYFSDFHWRCLLPQFSAAKATAPIVRQCRARGVLDSIFKHNPRVGPNRFCHAGRRRPRRGRSGGLRCCRASQVGNCRAGALHAHLGVDSQPIYPQASCPTITCSCLQKRKLAFMNTLTIGQLMWVAGGIQAGIVFVNFLLPRKLRVREGLVHVPVLLKQVFYVHWLYIVIVVGLFGALCFGFASELSGASPLGRFLSAFMAAFWLLRMCLQWFYYDSATMRQHKVLYALYTCSLVALVGILGWAAVRPLK